MRPLALFFAGLVLLPGGRALAASQCPAPHAMTFEVTHKSYRDLVGFTEGFEEHDGAIYESTGALGGGTRIMRIAPDGHVTVLNDSGQRYFGEGLTFLGGQLYQLSWQDHLVFVYDGDVHLLRTMPNPHEGWGMTNDGHDLIFGDGSDHLYFAAPADFSIRKTLDVRAGVTPVTNINELEYVDGKIYANIWMTRRIVRIDAATGCIEAEASLDTLWDRMTDQERDYTRSDANYVLNGISYDRQSGLFTLTGKEWPFLFSGRFKDLGLPALPP